jgi:hypothetical protein
MDLMSIIKERINSNRINTVDLTDRGAANIPASTSIKYEIKTTTSVTKDPSCSTPNEDSPFFETISPVLLDLPQIPAKNKCAESQNKQSSVGQPHRLNEAADSWPSDIQSLIDWFLTLVPPPEPFYLADHIKVIDPIKFFEKLRSEIEAGPTGPRARLGTLQSDLRALHVKLRNNENKI